MSKVKIRTRLTDLLGIDVPIMLAGMGGIANQELVAAVSNAGGFGTWGSATDVSNVGPDELGRRIQAIRDACHDKPFGVDILIHGASGGVMSELIEVFANGGAKVFISGRGFPRKSVIETFHSKGMLVGSIAGKLKHAEGMVKAGVDIIIVQGYEGGGHTGSVATSVLLPQVVDMVRSSNRPETPVVAAGGIFDGSLMVPRSDCST